MATSMSGQSSSKKTSESESKSDSDSAISTELNFDDDEESEVSFRARNLSTPQVAMVLAALVIVVYLLVQHGPL